MFKKVARLATFFLMIWGANFSYAATDCVISRALFKDDTAQMTFEQVKDQSFKPAKIILAEGFSSAAFWLRLEVDPKVCDRLSAVDQGERDLIIRIQPGCFLDEIQLYDPTFSISKSRIIGDRYLWSSNEYSSLNFNFAVPAGNSPRFIWLRMETTSTTLMRVQVFSAQDISAVDRTQEIGFSLYISLLTIVFLWALGIWAVDRDRLVGIFALNQFASLIHATVVMGYFKIFMSPYVHPHISDLLSSVVILFFAFNIALFHFNFYHQFDSKKLFNTVFAVCILLFPINVILLFSENVRLALNINLIGLWVLSISLLFIPFFGVNWEKVKKPILSKYMLFGVYLLSNVLGWLNLLPALGFFSGNAFTPYAGLAYGLITGFVFLMLLQHRYRTIQEQKILEVSKANANAQSEKNKREEQGKFLAMLTHELKTPLSVLRMGFNSDHSFQKFGPHIDQAIMDMNNIVERCVMADKFDEHSLSILYESCDIREIVKDISAIYKDKADILINCVTPFFVKTDIHLFRTILVNLIDNSVKYGAENKIIQIDVCSERFDHNLFAIIKVSNFPGHSGMPDPAQVFSKYYRAPRAYEKTGSGLGLYLIKNISKVLGFDLQHLRDTKRVIFVLKIPLKDPKL